jgi:hypothetical protein
LCFALLQIPVACDACHAENPPSSGFGSNAQTLQNTKDKQIAGDVIAAIWPKLACRSNDDV